MAGVYLTGTCFGAEIQPETLIAGLDRYFASNEKVEFSFNAHCVVMDPTCGMTASVLYNDVEASVRRDGPNWRVNRKETFHLPPKSVEEYDTILKGDRLIIYEAKNLFGDPSGGGYLKDVPRGYRALVEQRRAFFPIHGVFYDSHDLSLSFLLRQGTATVRAERKGERDYWVLQSRSKWGHVEVWFDQSQPTLPVYVRQSQGSEDWVAENTPMTKYPPLKYPDGSTTRIVQIEREYGALAVDLVGTEPMVTKFYVAERTDLSDDKQIAKREEVTYKNFRRNPEWGADAFRLTAVPDGARFYDFSEPQIRYEWRDGEIVKSLSEDAINNLEGLRVKRSRWIGRGLLALGLVAIVGLLAVFWYRRRLQGGQT
jgi:hypothetical protein